MNQSENLSAWCDADKIKYDSLGRIVIEDEALLDQISGAYSPMAMLAGSNAGGCINGSCA